MVTTLEVALLLLVLAVLFGAYRVIRVVRPFIVNAVVGLLVLLLANWLGLGVQITAMAVLICALGGVPGALLVIILAYLDIAFAGMVAPIGIAALG